MPINEQALADALEQDTVGQEENPSQEESPNQEENSRSEDGQDVQLSALEIEAREMGHTSKEDFIAKGGDAERWKTPYEYISHGKIQARIDNQNAKMNAMEGEFNKRVESLNKMHQQQLAAKVDALKVEQRNAVEGGDTDRYDAAQKEIDSLQVVEKDDTSTQTKDPVILAWEEKNVWINEPNNPKAQMAIGLWNGYINDHPNSNAQQALEYVDKQLETMSPQQHNARRDNATNTERGSQSIKPKGKISSIKQLSPEWQHEWNSTGFDIWGGDEKAFIQAVRDSEIKS